ncbi:MAG TPA: hotdog fold thioesterase [Steroidobacteraceae bacterium]|jgi:1,4-dihydroxy-2-naphthoyl-CoA hydrolase|nr:hotdog fold thioesterase [Steroidobacteraceae bacterium]
MSIWFSSFTVDDIADRGGPTMVSHIGIRFTEVGPDFLRATMPVDDRTRQNMGILHGGASVALAESVGSVAANMCVDPSRFYCVGQEINANHLRPVASGLVTATAKPYHIGSRSQVWHIEIHDERQRLVCVSRLTMAVVDRRASRA